MRDQLLGRPAKDFDLVTDARPEQVAEIAGACGWRTVQELGRNFGTVVLVVAGNAVEVATYRGEVSGQEPRSQPTFGKSLIEDLARRDFTINAMAMDLQGRVIDPSTAGRILRIRLSAPWEKRRNVLRRMVCACFGPADSRRNLVSLSTIRFWRQYRKT